jgi:hypothetical protein
MAGSVAVRCDKVWLGYGSDRLGVVRWVRVCWASVGYAPVGYSLAWGKDLLIKMHNLT